MPSSAVRTFGDPEDYGAAVRAAKVDVTPTGRGAFTGFLIQIDLHRLWTQRLFDNLPRVLHAACTPTRAIITFAVQSAPDPAVNGATIPPGTIVRHSQGHDLHQRSSSATLFAAMSLPIEDMAAAGAAIAGCDLSMPQDMLVVKPTPDAMARLQRLHAASGHLAEVAPDVLANPEAARGLEQELIEAMVACLSTPDIQEDKAARRRHQQIMRRFHAVIEANTNRALYVVDLCTALNVPERTLRTCCLEYLGIGPIRYLHLRRMQLARHELRQADPAGATVTDIAVRYGFWELGRFAGEYRHLFGEPPSATLHHPPA